MLPESSWWQGSHLTHMIRCCNVENIACQGTFSMCYVQDGRRYEHDAGRAENMSRAGLRGLARRLDKAGYNTMPKKMLLRIGPNTADGYRFGIATLRHNPVARDSFDHFGAGLLPGFDTYPNWKTAAPHNIRRVTPQNQNCAVRHDDSSLFLGQRDLSPVGPSANQDLIRPRP